MHIANLNWHELSREAFARIDYMSRKGMLAEGRRNYREGQNAYFSGTEEELRRLPEEAMEERPYEGFKGDAVEFDRILLGEAPGRRGDDEVTFFQNSGNQGIQFSSVGALCYREAKAAGLGHELPTEWFLQDIRD